MEYFYYPIVQFLINKSIELTQSTTTTTQIQLNDKVVIDKVSSKFDDIIGMINEPQCTDLLKCDTQVRGEINRAIQCVSDVYSAILLRCKKVPQTDLFSKYQDQMTFAELD